MTLAAWNDEQRRTDTELPGDIVDHDPRDLVGVEECAEEPDGGELNGEAEAVVVAPSLVDERAIRVVEVEEASVLRA